MRYELEPAAAADRCWLDDLRRAAYYDLMIDTFGQWEEERHRRHCQSCWAQGDIRIVSVGGERVGMIRLAETDDTVELCEIQLLPAHQGRGIGFALMRGVIERARRAGKGLVLSVALKNRHAVEFYRRLGFEHTDRDDTHYQMRLQMRFAARSGAGDS